MLTDTEREQLAEIMARGLCAPDKPRSVHHRDPNALAEPPHWGVGSGIDSMRRLTNAEVLAYAAHDAIDAALAAGWRFLPPVDGR